MQKNSSNWNNQQYMALAIEQAKMAFNLNEVPVGAVIVDYIKKQIIVKSHNLCIKNNDPTAHAEIVAIRDAIKILGKSRLENCDIYVSLEPCTMCAAAISLAKFRRLYFSAYDFKAGAVDNGVRYYNSRSCNHIPDVYSGIMEQESADLLRNFFKSKRNFL